MVRVAVAGGTSPTLGKAIVTAILETGKHEVVILSRAGKGQDPSKEASKYGARVQLVDYESITSLSTALEGVHTLISVLNAQNPEQMTKYHTNMLSACIAAKVARFAPADFGLGPAAYSQVELIADKGVTWKVCEDLGRSSGVECADFVTGLFMNYFAQGQKFPDTPEGQAQREDILAGLEDDFMVEYIDIPNRKIVIPVDDGGKPTKSTATHLRDIGRFVAAALDLPPGKWDGFLGIVGDTCDWQSVVDVLKAKCGIEIVPETINYAQCMEKIRACDEQLKKGFSMDALKSKWTAQIMAVNCKEEVGGTVIEPKLNSLCPDVKPMSVEEYLIKAWGPAS